MKKIVCAHLFNDYSGSPLVLSTVIESFKSDGKKIDIITSNESSGFLSGLDANIIDNGYVYLNNKYLRLMMFLYCQVKMFFQTLKYRNEDVTIYVNTLLPFGVAIAGKLMGKKVIYHFHETSLNPLLLKKFLKWVASLTSNEIVYVSKFLEEKEGISSVSSKVIYNTLSDDFINVAKQNQSPKSRNKEFVILMLCSLKKYKGVNEFVELSRSLPVYIFDLVLNATLEEIEDYFKGTTLPSNLNLYPRQSNVHPFFKQADLVLNLSHPEEWIETFGMTLLEAMQYGIPVIAPPCGGPTEIVFPDFNGYLIDQRNEIELSNQIETIANDKDLYRRLSNNSSQVVKRFTRKSMEVRILELVN